MPEVATLPPPPRPAPPAVAPGTAETHQEPTFHPDWSWVDVTVPPRAMEVDGFVDWYVSGEFPTGMRVSLVNGNLVLEPMADELFTHNALKTVVAAMLLSYAEQTEAGRVFGDGALYAHRPTGPANEADATFLTYDSLRSGRVSYAEHPDRGVTVIHGAADLVVECVSNSSVRKDTVGLREAYLAAGVREYWILDGRGETLGFTLLSRADDPDEWAETTETYPVSPLLNRRVRIERQIDPLGDPNWKARLESADA